MDQRPSMEEIFGSFIPYKLTPDTWVLSFMEGSEYIYLLEGETKALLIDTGWGASTLRPTVEKLTDKPLIVINTHFHPDHAGGNAYFKEVLVSEDYKVDAPSVEQGFGPFPSENMPYPNYKKILVTDGDSIDLGGRTIRIFKAKNAHCFSSLFLFDEKQKMLFVGDEFEAGQVNLFDNSKNPDSGYDIKTCLENMRANALFIKGMLHETKYLLPNHNGSPISFHYVDSFIGLIEAIFTRDVTIEEKLHHKYLEQDPKASTLCRVRYKDVSVILNKFLLSELQNQTW